MKKPDELKIIKEEVGEAVKRLSPETSAVLRGLKKDEKRYVINNFIAPNRSDADFNPTPEDVMVHVALFTRDSVRSAVKTPPPIPEDAGVDGAEEISDDKRATVEPDMPIAETDEEARFFLDNCSNRTLQLDVKDIEEVKSEDARLSDASAGRGADEAIQLLNTGDLEFMSEIPSTSDELDAFIEPAEPPLNGMKEMFVGLLSRSKIDEAFMQWLEADGSLDDVLLEDIGGNEDVIRAFFRMCCAEAKMFDDAKRLVSKTASSIDFREQIALTGMKMHTSGQKEILNEFKSRFSDIFDFSIFTGKQDLVQALGELGTAKGRIRESEQYIIGQEDDSRKMFDENMKLTRELASARQAVDQAEKRASSLHALVNTKDKENNTLSAEVIGMRQSLETANIRIAEIQAILDEEKKAMDFAGINKISLENSLSSEFERRKDAERRVDELELRLQDSVAENKAMKSELASVKDSMSKENEKLKEDLRLANQKADNHKTSAIAEQMDNASLRRKTITSEQAVLDMESKLARLDDALHTIDKLNARLAEMELENSSLMGKLSGAEDSAMAERDALSADIKSERVRSDELHARVIMSEEENAALRADLTSLSSIQRKFENAQQRIVRLEAHLDEERAFNANLRQKLTDNLKPQTESVIPEAEISAPAAESVFANALYEKLIAGDMKGSWKIWKKGGRTDELNARIRQAYDYCIKNQLTDTAVKISMKFGGKVDV